MSLVPHETYRDWPWWYRLEQYLKPKFGYRAMPFKRKRGWPFNTFSGGTYAGMRIKRRGFRRRRFRRRAVTGRSNKVYRKKGFMGSRRFTPRKIARCIESKMLEIVTTNNITVTNGAVTTTREFIFAPLMSLTQGTGAAQFTGTCIWLKGVWLQFFLMGGSNDSYHVQIDMIRDTDDTDFSAAAWTQRTDAGGETVEHYYDRVYGATSGTTDSQNFTAPPNQRGGGPTCVFRKRLRLINYNSAASNPARLVSIYVPFNQQVRFKHMLNATDLTTAPNYFEHGTPVFVLKYYNSVAGGAGTQNGLVISGTKARIYFKDP